MKITADRFSQTDARFSLAIRCPGCGNYGTFEAMAINDLDLSSGLVVGLRRCPYDQCRTVVYYVRRGTTIVLTVPFDRIDFDKADVPEPVLQAFEEAITCHAVRCFVASAMLVRKTLELICADRGAKGKDLKERIKALRERIVVPNELLEGMDDLRLLGNDAAHVESRIFDAIGKEELDVAIEFSKEILKAVYQYKGLTARLKGLKKTAPQPA